MLNRKVFAFEVHTLHGSTKAKCIFVDFEYFVLKSHKKSDAKSAWNQVELEWLLSSWMHSWKSTVFYQTLHFKQAHLCGDGAAREVFGITNWHKTMGHDGRHLKSHSHPTLCSCTFSQLNAVLMTHFRRVNIKFHGVVHLPHTHHTLSFWLNVLCASQWILFY